MKRLSIMCGTIAVLGVAFAAASYGQSEATRFTFAFVGAPRARADEAPDDPGYAAYRDGYAKILNEEWESARRIFDEMRAKYPKSRYADDAQYWSAYALVHTDRSRAIDAYRAFIKQNPRSRYVDDAIVDLAELQPGDLRIMLPPAHVEGAERAPQAMYEQQRAIEAALARQERVLKRQQEEMSRYMFISPNAIVKPRIPDREALSPAVEVKIEALRALGHAPETPAAFEKLRVIATDNRQPEPVREVALESAARFRDPEVLSFLVTVARSDSSRDLQVLAVDLIGEHRAAKNERVEKLITLYEDVPRDRQEQRKAIFYSIAGIGNDRAVDFLKTVAISDEDYDLRREAVFYLGGIGTERARAALFEILKDE
jgi:outer membrane protein assembly factor BamD (BamD/ComL family)